MVVRSPILFVPRVISAALSAEGAAGIASARAFVLGLRARVIGGGEMEMRLRRRFLATRWSSSALFVPRLDALAIVTASSKAIETYLV